MLAGFAAFGFLACICDSGVVWCCSVFGLFVGGFGGTSVMCICRFRVVLTDWYIWFLKLALVSDFGFRLWAFSFGFWLRVLWVSWVLDSDFRGFGRFAFS